MRTRLPQVLLTALCLAVLPAIAQMPEGSAAASRAAMRLSPDPLQELMSLGRILEYRGSLAESRAIFRDAVRLYPTNAEANMELGLNLMMSGEADKAASYFYLAIQLEPGLAGNNTRLAKTLMKNGQFDAARRRLILACCLKPEDAEARLTLVFCLNPEGDKASQTWGAFGGYQGRLDKVFNQYEGTLHFRPDAASYDKLGFEFESHGKFVEALLEYREAVRQYPNDASALNNLAWTLTTCPRPDLRNGKVAVQFAAKAVELTGWQQPGFMGTLAAAYAEDGQFSKAVEMATRARDLALSTGQQEVAARNEQLLKLYSAGKTVNSANGP